MRDVTPDTTDPAAGLSFCRGTPSRAAPVLMLAVGLVLADGSVVTLALPELLVELRTSVQGVAAIIGVYTAVLALALPQAGRPAAAAVAAAPAAVIVRFIPCR